MGTSNEFQRGSKPEVTTTNVLLIVGIRVIQVVTYSNLVSITHIVSLNCLETGCSFYPPENRLMMLLL